MQREGHQVRTVMNGQQALDAIAEKQPDLVLLDVMMPHGNGYDVWSRLLHGARASLLTGLSAVCLAILNLDEALTRE